MTSITIPNGVTFIEKLAFAFCINLVDIVYKGTKEQWNRIKKESDWDLYTGDYVVHCTDGDIFKKTAVDNRRFHPTVCFP